MARRKHKKVRVRRLTEHLVRRFVEAHRVRTGLWPRANSGAVHDAYRLTWAEVDRRLWHGETGQGGQNLRAFILEHFGVETPRAPIPIDEKTILRWADAHHEQTGQWPGRRSGPVSEAPWVTWAWVNDCLYVGRYGFRGGKTLFGLLRDRRGAGPRQLTRKMILAWADAHFRARGRWPSNASGAVIGVEGETWRRIDVALRWGRRGLRRRDTLARLLRRRRDTFGARDRLTEARILRWAEAHRRRTGKRPGPKSGRIPDTREHWFSIHRALMLGLRGLPGGESLAAFLDRHFGRRRKAITIDQILKVCDRHKRRTGRWPTNGSGYVSELGMTWHSLDATLRRGGRGLSGGDTLARLLSRRRGVRNEKALPKLTYRQIDTWARAHRKATGRWPNSASGPVKGADENWAAIDASMRQGGRGLKWRSSLYKRYWRGMKVSRA